MTRPLTQTEWSALDDWYESGCEGISPPVFGEGRYPLYGGRSYAESEPDDWGDDEGADWAADREYGDAR